MFEDGGAGLAWLCPEVCCASKRRGDVERARKIVCLAATEP